ncbi:MAG: DNA mismatch repair protein MutS [Clostridia bacterium]
MTANLTPMMQQYITLKEKYSDCLLFFRLGDFYEMFFDDAITASKELEIVLTGRDCGLSDRAPMCGVPHHSVNSYINKLISKGYKVAICEQLTDPKESNGLVERDVIRVITPGTVIEESMLDERSNNYIASVFLYESGIGIAYCDVSTGSFRISEFSGGEWENHLFDELARIQPTEIILNDAMFLQEHTIRRLQSMYYIQCLGGWMYDYAGALERLLSQFKVASLSGFGCDNCKDAICAAGALLAYLSDTQKNTLTHINKLVKENGSCFMQLDAATRRNLELTKPIHFEGSKKNTLLYVIDKTNTAMGGRLLRSWVEQPLQSINDINSRLDAVEELAKKHPQREELCTALSSMYDIERLCSRIAYGTASARDCESLRVSLGRLPDIIFAISALEAEEFKRIRLSLEPMDDIYGLLCAAIVDEPPLSVKDGGIIKTGYNADVDAYRLASANGKDWIAKLESDTRESTGIKNLKIGYNRVFGYYIEVTKAYQHLVPYTFERKQTLANCERYITPELKELEESILGAEEKCVDLEYKLFIQIRGMLLSCINRLQLNAQLIAQLDVYRALADVAFTFDYCRPTMRDDGVLSICDGRHPVVERAMKDSFVPNNTQLDKDENRLLILTGPNMAGKSTYMRQVALITLMAHIGSFVPASSAEISITDRIFTRVGAADNLASGQSTFMVEMTEMAGILNNATADSLLIVDEIGRGTSTFDGLSIAWAVLEYIHDKGKCGAKTLFATHYHELTELEGRLDGVKNYRISVKEIGEDIIFLRKIMRGGADKSFGIQVSRLAGLPENVIKRAKEILKQLETADINHSLMRGFNAPDTVPTQLSLFASGPDDIIKDLREMDINELSPMEALSKLYDLHMRAKS